MLVKLFDESDGKCYAETLAECYALKDYEVGCGTYRCKFYKPRDCKDWIRLDTKNMVRLYEPDEIGRKTRY